jgi:uncharacterized repeat protein (TIGR03803 family)
VFRLTTNGSMTTVISFAETNGALPLGGLIRASDGAFYGTTERGGNWNMGTVFKVTTNGVLTTLVSFGNGHFWGAWPSSGLVQGSDGFLYGTMSSGVFRVSLDGDLTEVASFGTTGCQSPLVEAGNGAFYGTSYGTGSIGGDGGYGYVFRVTTNGAVATITSFNMTNGASPSPGLVLGPDGALYGTTSMGGSDYFGGTVFRVTTNGVLTVLFAFQGVHADRCHDSPEGAQPFAGMVLGRDGQLYGTTTIGGSNGWGTVFQLTTNGVLRTLASFDGPYDLLRTALVQGTDGAFYGTTDAGGPNGIGNVFQVTTNGALASLFAFTNTEGAYPQPGLVLGDDGALYGTTQGGGTHNHGEVFRVTTNGMATTLVSFNAFDSAGESPNGGLVRGDDGALYGTTFGGGDGGGGTVFRVTTNGALTGLASFGPDAIGGWQPDAGLVKGADGAFYGTTHWGGTSDWGTVFRVTTNGELTTLASFSNTNGAMPTAPLVQGCDGALYGTTSWGGPGATDIDWGQGTIFRVTTNGVLTTLLAFDWSNSMSTDAGLLLGDDCALYGTGGGKLFRLTTDGQMTPVTSIGGSSPTSLMKGPDGATYGSASSNGCIIIFRLSTNGLMTTVASLEPSAGTAPCGSLVAAGDGFLYGVASQGGSRGGGSIFRAKLPDYPLRMRPVRFPCGPDGYVDVTFLGEPGATYRLLRATNLSGPWQFLGKVTTATDGLGRWDETPPNRSGAFYRVVR